MDEMKISEMLACMLELQQKHSDEWSPLVPATAPKKLLWMIGEIGEVIDIIKKHGEEDIMEDLAVRKAFVEEMVDVHMYFLNVCHCYGIDAEEFSEAFRKKHEYNVKRDFNRPSKAVEKSQMTSFLGELDSD